MQIMTRRLILREWEGSDWVAAHAILDHEWKAGEST